MGNYKRRMQDSFVLSGVITNLDQLKEYVTITEQYYMTSGVWPNHLGASLLVHSEDDEALMVLSRRKRKKGQGVAFMRYAFAENLGDKKSKKFRRRKAINRTNLAVRIEKLLATGQATVDVYSLVPQFKDPVVLGKFNYTGLLIDSTRMRDEQSRDKKEEPKVTGLTIERPAQRKFLGFPNSVDCTGAFFGLASGAYQRYDRFALQFSSPNKMPFYVVLENSNKELRTGPYNVVGAYFDDEVIQQRINAREAAVRSDPETYVLDRVKTRFSSGKLKVEGFSNPPQHPIIMSFGIPVKIDTFLMNLSTKLHQDSNGEQNGLVEEDQDITRREIKRPTISLGDKYQKEAESKLDDLFGDIK